MEGQSKKMEIKHGWSVEYLVQHYSGNKRLHDPFWLFNLFMNKDVWNDCDDIRSMLFGYVEAWRHFYAVDALLLAENLNDFQQMLEKLYDATNND